MLSLSAIRARHVSPVSPVSCKENKENKEDVKKDNNDNNVPIDTESRPSVDDIPMEEQKDIKKEEKEENKKESKCQKIMYSLFIEHPASINMNYFEHFMRGISLAFQTGVATCALLVHSVVPKLFPSAGSSIIASLHKEIEDFKKKSK